MSALSIWQRLSELKAGIATIGARLRAPTLGNPSPVKWDRQVTMNRASVVNSATYRGSRSEAVHRPRPSRYY